MKGAMPVSRGSTERIRTTDRAAILTTSTQPREDAGGPRDNCQARFVARYGTEEDADTETVNVEKCGLCGRDSFKKDNFKDCTLRLMAQVTARNVNRGE